MELAVPATPAVYESVQAMAEKVYVDVKREHLIEVRGKITQGKIGSTDLRTIDNYDAFMQATQVLLDRPRDARTQADVEKYAKLIRDANGNSLLAVRNTVVEALETIAAEPIDPPMVREEEIIIEQPGFWSRLFGAGTTRTRVRR